ncbi:MAG: hypothetical protein LUM44_14680 [Pyrinomonadaceae bacterium]|nr:hypothetical protein [Pyrinomonadaceae bacterium]
MAESIYGEDFNIHFTNGGAAALFESLILLGSELPEEKTLRELVDYLQYSLDNFGCGCRFFDIENLPNELNFEHLAEYARLINLFCIALTKADSKLDVNISWNYESRMNWLARLMNLYLLIEKQLAKNGIEISPQNVPLSPKEAVTVERQRLMAVYDKTKNRLEKAERIKLWGKIVDLFEQDKTVTDGRILGLAYYHYAELTADSASKAELVKLWEKNIDFSERNKSETDLKILSSAYYHYVELLDASVEPEKELAVWKRLLEIETRLGGDEEEIKLIVEIIEGIEKL